MNDSTDEKPKEAGAGGMLLFLLLFLLPASFTYFSGLLLGVAMMSEQGVTGVRTTFLAICYAILAICYAIMVIACWIRGRQVDRKWLLAFPIVGGVFDMFLIFIPFVPSIMNIAVLATGIPPKKG